MIEVTVEGDARGFAQVAQVRTHTLTADEPRGVAGVEPRVEGTDTGPTPHEILLVALGTCTSMTVAMYARRKNWPLSRVRVKLSHIRDAHAAPPDRITRTITLEGNLDETMRERLVEIANKCPVHRTLTEGAAIATSLAESS